MKVQISEISNKEEISGLIISELKDIGVKCRKDKKNKVVQERTCRKRIFRTHLHLLELTDVILANGGVVEIPKFVADACNRILEQVGTEGIFRKAGSSIRQKEIRISLEAGIPLGKSHHVIDVANVVKSFFRELPEPLIPTTMQETLLRGLLIGENRMKAILLTCLLLPPLTINTLSFFMQFLHTVTLSSHLNKMPAENLAIIFTPGLMPFSDISSHRFTNHVKIVQLLIENAHSIGTVPDCIIDKLQIHEVVSNTPSKSRSFEALAVTQKKKKKRRSGSLTQMFNGLRKIVASARGSSENLESTPENKSTSSNALPAEHQQQQQPVVVATPFLLKSTVKRKFTEPVCAFSAKKKKDLLALLPSNSGGLLPNTPLTKEPKKSRLSLGGRRHMKNVSNNLKNTSMERRWSIVGSGWTKSKNKDSADNRMCCDIAENKTLSGPLPTRYTSPVVSRPTVSKLSVPQAEHPVVENLSSEESASGADCSSDYVRISKNEYEAIKERVAAIETRISQEFNSLSRRSKSPLLEMDQLSGPDRVATRYEQIVQNTEALTSPTTEQLAQRLSRGLKIRRSSEHRVMRSPSARKIGTLRRRSQEKSRLSRNQTWHISTTVNNVETASKQAAPLVVPQSCFYSKSNLKRGRPNTLNTGLQQQCKPLGERINGVSESPFNCCSVDDNWTDGKVFFNNNPPLSCMYEQTNLFSSDHSVEESKGRYKFDNVLCTPVKSNEVKTPMLPPSSVPRKISSRNQNSALKSVLTNRVILSTPNSEEVSGRASIARLRAQNAGMVMAKAKIFDGLGANCNSDNDSQPEQTPLCIPNRRKSRGFGDDATISKALRSREEKPFFPRKVPPSTETPTSHRKKTATGKSPGYIQKRQRLPGGIRCQDKQILDTITTDENLIQPRKICNMANTRNLANITIRNIASPSTPRNRKHLSVNSPRRVRTQGVMSSNSRIRTPLKTYSQSLTVNSPRLGKTKQTSRRGHLN